MYTVSRKTGTSTGTGSEQTIPHGLVDTPHVTVTPTATGATATWWANSTNIYITVTNEIPYQYDAYVL